MNVNLLVARTSRAACPRSLCLAGAFALTMALSSVALRAAAAPAPSVAPAPDLPIVLQLPTGKKLTAFSKYAIGAADHAPIVTKVCGGQVTEEISNLYVKFQVAPWQCDEGFSKDRLNGTMQCWVNIIRRKADLRGCFSGRWRLLSSTGLAIAEGTMEGTVGCGSHRPPGTPGLENCSEPKHFEGKMTGRVLLTGAYQGAEICATLAGTGPLQPATPQQMSLEGVVISACVP
jgi:hypothetical protein